MGFLAFISALLLSCNQNPQIMNTKIKSLIYFSCFVFASVFYHATIEDNQNQLSEKIEITETNAVVDSETNEI